MKKLFLIPMSVCWLYFMSGIVALILIHLSILVSVLVPNIPFISNVLTNVLDLLATLGDGGFVGLIALITIVGQYFLAYRLYLFFKTRAS
jgi:hypothetical protein